MSEEGEKLDSGSIGCMAVLVLVMIVGAVGSAISSLHDKIAGVIGPQAATGVMWGLVGLAIFGLISWINAVADKNRTVGRFKYGFLAAFLSNESAKGKIALMNLSASLRNEYERFRGLHSMRRTPQSIRQFFKQVHDVDLTGDVWSKTGVLNKRQLNNLFEEVARILVRGGNVNIDDFYPGA